MTKDLKVVAAALLAVAAIVFADVEWLHITNTTTVALTFLLVVLVVAATSRLWIAVVTSIVAMLCFNFFVLPPVGAWTIEDPQNWVALGAFFTVSLVAISLSSVVRARADAALARHDADLARKGEELKAALLASLGHNLRTPLTAIRVAASNLQASWLDEAERREQGELVLAEVERLTRLFENILEMARIDAGAIATEPRWIDPAELVEAARDQVGHTLAHRAVSVTSRGGRLVRIDPRLTAAALSHVLENAAQYTPDTSPIAVHTAVTNAELVLTVRDDGPGIAQADLPRLFDRFFRGGQSRARVSGTGMGLSIARGLLAAEGGRISAENCAGGGAEFTIVVPAESRVAEANPVAAS
jgi:two-component system, OmpR family, sensor histidine kinase KdpD